MGNRSEKLTVALSKDEKKKLKTLSMHRGESYAVCVRDLIRLAFKESEISQLREKEESNEESAG